MPTCVLTGMGCNTCAFSAIVALFLFLPCLYQAFDLLGAFVALPTLQKIFGIQQSGGYR